MIGEHGDTELPVYSSANVSGIDFDHFCQSCQRHCDQEVLRTIYEEVKNSAYEVIENKGATYYAIALAVLRISGALMRDEHSVLTVSVLPEGHYELNELCIGLPAIVGQGGIEKSAGRAAGYGRMGPAAKKRGQMKKVIGEIHWE